MSIDPTEAQILLVEDSEDDAFFFQRTLKKTRVNCQLAHVSNGPEATAYLQENSLRPLLVFLDLKIPMLNGFEVLKWIQNQPAKSQWEIIVLSGSDDPQDMASAQSFFVKDYLVKPLSVAQLQEKVEEWIKRSANGDGS